jgi:hypothetical protein
VGTTSMIYENTYNGYEKKEVPRPNISFVSLLFINILLDININVLYYIIIIVNKLILKWSKG